MLIKWFNVLLIKLYITYCNNEININNDLNNIHFIQGINWYQLKLESIAYYQCISLKYNKAPHNLRLATNILLNDFDISMCQSAMFKEDFKYHTVYVIVI